MTKTRSHALPIHCGDWIKSTSRLSAAERGYYLDLLIHSWDADEPLPDDETEQMQIARCTNRREWRRVWQRLVCRWERVEGGYRNRRLEEVRAELRESRERRAKSGSKGAKSRWQTDGKNNGKPHGKHDGKPNDKKMASDLQSPISDLHATEQRVVTPTTALLTRFDALHQAKTGERAVIQGGKDAAILARLCKTHGPERVEALMEAFFASDDPFIHQAGYTVGVFQSQAAKLIAHERVPPPPAKTSGARTVAAMREVLDDFDALEARADRESDGAQSAGDRTPGRTLERGTGGLPGRRE